MFIIIWICFGLAATAIAANRGESGVVWFIAGFLLGPIALLLVLLTGGVRCPHCQSKIHAKATVCPRCQREQPTPTQAHEQARAQKQHVQEQRHAQRQKRRQREREQWSAIGHTLTATTRWLCRKQPRNGPPHPLQTPPHTNNPRDTELRAVQARLRREKRQQRRLTPEAKAILGVIVAGCLGTLGVGIYAADQLAPPNHPTTASAATPTAPPSSSSQATSPGARAVIDWPSGQTDPLWLGINQDAYDRMLDAAIAHDTVGLDQLQRRGRIFSVAPGTPARVLDPGFMTSTVRVLQGPAQGRKGITAAEHVLDQ